MGLTHLHIEIYNPSDLDTTEAVELLVDSGAIYSVVPGSILEKLGIKHHSEQVFRLADGSTIVRKRGTAGFKHGGRTGGADVIFGEPNDSLLLGAHTLESLGLGLDPIRRELVDIPMVL
jgi:predicted aspartyl protease